MHGDGKRSIPANKLEDGEPVFIADDSLAVDQA
jgi:hypothetical protein